MAMIFGADKYSDILKQNAASERGVVCGCGGEGVLTSGGRCSRVVEGRTLEHPRAHNREYRCAFIDAARALSHARQDAHAPTHTA